VVVRPQRSGRARVTLRVEDGSRSVLTGRAQTRTLTRGTATTLSFPLRAAPRAAIASCAPQRLVVRAGTPPRRIGARSVALQPPRCGRFFGPQSVWNTPLEADAPLDPASAQITGDLIRQVDEEYRSGPRPTINTTQYSSPVYTVPRDQPTVRVHLDQPRGLAPTLEDQWARVPLPPDARPAAGTDASLAVWQPSTDTMWEFWQLRRAPDGWHAKWGGRLDRVTAGPGHFVAPIAHFGATATSLPLAGGLMMLEELRAGRIDHALALALPDVRAGVAALPAQRSDGTVESAVAVPEGARFRLDPALDLDTLGLAPPVLAIARAVQRYGAIVRDRAGVVAFYGEDPRGEDGDPYGPIFGPQQPSELLRTFPWRSLQLVEMDLRAVPRPGRECALGFCGQPVSR
jgi:hypothetical protein